MSLIRSVFLEMMSERNVKIHIYVYMSAPGGVKVISSRVRQPGSCHLLVDNLWASYLKPWISHL